MKRASSVGAASRQPVAPKAVHFQAPPAVLTSKLSSTKSSTNDPPVVGKSLLRRSKSFSHNDPASTNASFLGEYQGLVKKAQHGEEAY
ncbi:hypothetical protein V5799_024519 [Amblyomma americanum]|uniref:Uncharacterized protein n=1 Tax=Amblyomma americanum TaxID=6943 RepID=A0AAQ4EBS9_AMBAM